MKSLINKIFAPFLAMLVFSISAVPVHAAPVHVLHASLGTSILGACFSLLPFISTMVEKAEADVKGGATKKQVVLDAATTALTDIGALTASTDTVALNNHLGTLIDATVGLKNIFGWKKGPAIGPEPVVKTPPLVAAPAQLTGAKLPAQSAADAVTQQAATTLTAFPAAGIV